MGQPPHHLFPNIVWLEPCITELKQYALIHSCYKRKKTICAKPYKNASTPHGPSIELKLRSQNPTRKTNRNSNNQTGQNVPNNKNLHMVVPYQQGLSERIKNTCKMYGVQVHFKGQTIKGLLMAPKDKNSITNKSGVIYRYKCSEDGCEEEYIGEFARTFAERFKEHHKSPSPIHDHCNISGHEVTINNFTIIEREDQNLTSPIKEALFIRVNDPSLNRNIGKYHLPHIWDEGLHKTSDLKLKN